MSEREMDGGVAGNGGDGGLEERLLHGLLSGGAGAGPDAGDVLGDLADEPDASRRLGELQEFLSTCKASLQPEREPEAEGALVRRILNATTRRTGSEVVDAQGDPGWRGDLRLVKSFMHARWKASFLLRVAAASLLVHVAALPLLAYFGLRAEPREFTLSFGQRPVPEYADALEPEHQVEAEDVGELPEVREVPDHDELDVLNALQWARFHLTAGPVPIGVQAAGTGSSAGAVDRALAQRGSYLGARSDSRAAIDMSWALGDPDPLVRTIGIDHLLDRYVIERRIPPGLDGGLRDLGQAVDGPVRRLELRALLRARAYGMLDRGQIEALEGALEGDGESGLSWDPLAPHAPIDRAYLEALAEAVGPARTESPTVSSWLRWRE